ncbi:uncharacterized protein METZ01_LOCUS463859, partial [marine metagenome]
VNNRKLHDTMAVFDGLIVSKWSRAVFEDMKLGGVTAANCTCAVWEGFRDTMENIAKWHNWFNNFDDLLVPIKRASDIRRAKTEKKVGIVLGFQNISPIED